MAIERDSSSSQFLKEQRMSLPARIREAHERMLATLPVKTHSSDGLVVDYSVGRNGYRQSNSPKAVRINGEVFPSMTQAKLKLHVAPATIYKWIDCGKAVYVTEKLPP